MKGNLLYIAFIREDSEALGFVKKIHSQCKAFNNLGYNSFLYISTATEAILYQISNNEKKVVKRFEYSVNSVFNNDSKLINKKLSNLRRYKEFMEFIEIETKHLKPEKVYIRRIKPILPVFIKYLKECNRIGSKVYFEFPDYPTYSPGFNKTLQYLDYLYDKLAFLRVRKYLAKIVGVSIKKNIKDKKVIIIKNGIDLQETKLRSLTLNNKELHLIGVANVGFWHAYDRILKGLNEYYSTNPTKKVYFHMVGEGGAKKELEDLSKSLKLNKYVIFYGSKGGEELAEIFNKCHMGIGILGNHRKNLFGDSSLKNREYCARGLPFIIAAEDYDFGEDFPYSMTIPPDDSKLNINEVIDFYEEIVLNSPDYMMKMREYAELNLTWETKLKVVAED
ncbi:glycosyl transferase family 1 [Evansella sp. LMS18]|uniref:glycosyl transferase family 1 n=1 Tax=Evansella sp. LMS18 TaxID=2924033 RepID=UPI0020D095FC|nr:glycosyl transferase family 1 [Evansella sp. LMS18]UTR12121.1 glycosyl transferase family 1 [Evansella sp. LMS18]